MESSDNDNAALLAAGLTAIAWGLTGVFVRWLPLVSPVAVTAARLLIALARSLPLLFLFPGRRVPLASTLAQPVAYLLSALLTAYYLLATAASQVAPVAEVALLTFTLGGAVLAGAQTATDASGPLFDAATLTALTALFGLGTLCTALPSIASASPSHRSGCRAGDFRHFAAGTTLGRFVRLCAAR